MADRAEYTPDGWITGDVWFFRKMMDHEPPRPWSIWDTLRGDLRSRRVLSIWVRGFTFPVIGGGLVAIAIFQQQWYLLAGVFLIYRGFWLLGAWVVMARGAMQRFRMHPIASGVITVLEPHPIVPTILEVGPATRPNGAVVDVGCVLELAQVLKEASLPAEVLFLEDPTWQYQSIIAGRPLQARSSGETVR